MLKKLFISLIILSTLASDGILNIPVNICNILTYLNSDAGQSKNIENLEEITKDLKEISSFSSGTFKLTNNSLLKLGISDNGRYLPKSNRTFDKKSILDIKNVYLSIKLPNEASSKIQKSTILLKTDTSPPLLSI